jgi:hypothetical protein
MVAMHSTFLLLDHQAIVAQGKAEEVKRWGMM